METKRFYQQNMIAECASTIRQKDSEMKVLQEEKKGLEQRITENTSQLQKLTDDVEKLNV